MQLDINPSLFTEGCQHHPCNYAKLKHQLGGGFKYFLFSPLFGEDFQFDSYFSDGLKPPTSHLFPGHLNLVLSILVKNATEVPLPNWARVPQRREENSCLDQDGNRNVPKKEMLYYWIIK